MPLTLRGTLFPATEETQPSEGPWKRQDSCSLWPKRAGKAYVPSQALLGTWCVVRRVERFLCPHLSQFSLPPSGRVPPVCLTWTPGQSSEAGCLGAMLGSLVSSPEDGGARHCRNMGAGLERRASASSQAQTASCQSSCHHPVWRGEGGAPGEEDAGMQAHGA